MHHFSENREYLRGNKPGCDSENVNTVYKYMLCCINVTAANWTAQETVEEEGCESGTSNSFFLIC
mgnify:CR=1 FL=1